MLEKFSYYLDLKIKVSDAPNSRVFVRIDYMNEAGELRQTRAV